MKYKKIKTFKHTERDEANAFIEALKKQNADKSRRFQPNLIEVYDRRPIWGSKMRKYEIMVPEGWKYDRKAI